MDLNKATPPWHMKAACRSLGKADEIFFPVKSVEDRVGATAAKQYCDTCPAMYECLKAALDGNEYGVWGGLTQTERQRLRSKVKPERYATIALLQDLLELEMPRCSECGRHRKEKDDSGMCTECFYTARRAAEAKKKAQCSEEECTVDVHAKGKCVKHYHADLRAAKPGAGAARSRKSRAKKVAA